MQEFNEETKYQRAKERVKAIRRFYTDLIKYSIFIAILVIMYYFYFHWFRNWLLWIALFWGIGLVFKALKTFDWLPFLNKNWEDQKIKEYMDNDNDNDNEPSNAKWN